MTDTVPFIFSGKVLHGKKLGRTLGFPTANIAIGDTDIPPGVYAVQIQLANSTKIYFGVGSLREHLALFEVFIFDFSEDIYDTEITLSLVHFLRENQSFTSLDALQMQISRDVEEAKKFFS